MADSTRDRAGGGSHFFFLTIFGLRTVVLDVMSPSMRGAIVVGIGLFIAFIGLKNANVVVAAPSLLKFNAGQLLSVDSGIFWGGLVTTLVLTMRRVPGSMLIGIIIAAVAATACGKITINQIAGWPEFSQSAILQCDFQTVFTFTGMSFVAVFVFMDVFDTTGTLIGVTRQAGLMHNGEVPRMRQAMLADSAGTIVGACLGTSTVTSYIESAAGIEQGGRTGLTAVTVAILFLIALAFSPLIIAMGVYMPITSPALVVVGAMMFRNVQTIDWLDETEGVPAFLVILGIPLFFSIAEGIAVGLIVWPLLKVARGRHTDVSWAAFIIAAILLAYFLSIRAHI